MTSVEPSRIDGINNLFIAVSNDFSRFSCISLDDSHVRKWSCTVEELKKLLQYGYACSKENYIFVVGRL